MAYEFETLVDMPIPLIYDEVIDTLRCLQLNVDSKAGRDIELKRYWYEKIAEDLPLDEWRGCYRRLEADRFLAESPIMSEGQKLSAYAGIVVTGILDLPEYLFDEDVPIDDIAVSLLNPHVHDIDTGIKPIQNSLLESANQHLERVYLPVLAVSSCTKLSSPSSARTRWDAERAALLRAAEQSTEND